MEPDKLNTFVSVRDQIWLAKGCTKRYLYTVVTVLKYFPCQSWC